MTETSVQTDWLTANQRDLTAALSRIRGMLDRRIEPVPGAAIDPAPNRGGVGEESPGNTIGMHAWNGQVGSETLPSTVVNLGRVIGLSPFERDLLLLCAGVELDGSFADLCAQASGDPSRAYPTFSLALAALPDAHWSALTPTGPLRRWRLIELDASRSIVDGRLRIDERVLHYLTGLQHLDERLEGYVQAVASPGALPPSHRGLAEHAASVWTRADEVGRLAAIQFCGGDPTATLAVAAATAEMLQLNVLAIDASSLPSAPVDLEMLRTLALREAMLTGSVLLVDGHEVDRSDAAREALVTRFAERVRGALMIAGSDRRRLPSRPVVTFDVEPAPPDEQLEAWAGALGCPDGEIDPELRRIAAQFSLSPRAIAAACSRARAMPCSDGDRGLPRGPQIEQLWDAARIEARPRLDDLAQRVDTSASWDDLVLPEREEQTLRDVARQVRCRMVVYDEWGFGQRSSRGLGISALLAGPSGTGKTLAAEVIANELRLDLYRIDLSRVVSKYIGETEKNLRRVFDAAESGGAVLLFDEADALFGRRSEVKDSHDRYANIEVSYLLQRMESYRGLAILTTNMKSALDGAFLRRIRFIIRFPFPEPSHRAEIWRRIFPPETPVEGLDPERLAQLDIAGGTIRNIALSAAFLAADAGDPVRMRHLLAAARREYTKLEKSLTDVEIRGWL